MSWIPGGFFLQREAEFEIYGYVILENHLHLIASSPDLSRDMQRFKSYTAKRIIDYLEQIQAKRVLELLALFKRAHKKEAGATSAWFPSWSLGTSET